eukprot:s575_g7.t2
MAESSGNDFAQFQERALEQTDQLVAEELILQHLHHLGVHDDFLEAVGKILAKVGPWWDAEQSGENSDSLLMEVVRQWKLARNLERAAESSAEDVWSSLVQMRLRARQFTGVPADGQWDATWELLQTETEQINEEENEPPQESLWALLTGRQTTGNRPLDFEEEVNVLRVSGCPKACCHSHTAPVNKGKEQDARPPDSSFGWLNASNGKRNAFCRQIGSLLSRLARFCEGDEVGHVQSHEARSRRWEEKRRGYFPARSPTREGHSNLLRKSTSLPSMWIVKDEISPSPSSTSSRRSHGLPRHLVGSEELDRAAILRGRAIQLIGLADHLEKKEKRLDLCVTKPMSLPELLEEHARDVQGSIQQRSYRLPPVLWLNLDRFAYDRVAKCGKKRQVKVTFPERLNTWMLAPMEAPWAQRLRTCVESRRSISEELDANRRALDSTAEATHNMTEQLEQEMHAIAEQQEALLAQLFENERHLDQLAEEQELLYELRAVIVHRGVVDHGHYFAYVRSPSGPKPWCCLNDSNVSLCDEKEMRRMAEGSTFEDEGDDMEVETEELHAEDATRELRFKDSEKVHCAEILTGQAESSETRQGLWHWLNSFGCLPSVSRRNSEEGFPAPVDAEVSSTPKASEGASPNSPYGQPILAHDPRKSPGRPTSPTSPASLNLGRSSTEARCLVYVRRGGKGCDKLLDEVRQRIPGQLQEQIDVCNQQVLGKAVERVVADVTRCLQHLQGHPDGQEMQAILRTADWVRSEAGMSMTRAYLLRACWRLHIPWLPEELCPTALPPDFRMYYGRAARQLLLDALIRQGQHDVAGLAASGEADAFAPPEMQEMTMRKPWGKPWEKYGKVLVDVAQGTWALTREHQNFQLRNCSEEVRKHRAPRPGHGGAPADGFGHGAMGRWRWPSRPGIDGPRSRGGRRRRRRYFSAVEVPQSD